jgi:signal transduction histidine kinase/ligand-binding sensor domain-containing protein
MFQSEPDTRAVHSLSLGSRVWRDGVVVFALFLVLLSLLPASKAIAAPQAREFHQTSWGSEDGLGAVFDVQQAGDGYLWLTTSRGVLRFDGVKFETMEEVTNGAIHTNDVLSVLLSHSGAVWLTTRTAGLLLWNDQRVTEFAFDRQCISVALTGGMVEDLDGSLWVRGLSGLYHLRGSFCERVDSAHGYPGGYPAAILVDHQATVWVKAPSGELLSQARGESRFRIRQYVSGPSSSTSYLHEGPDGSLWLSDEESLRRIDLESFRSSSPHTKVRDPRRTRPFGDFTFGTEGLLWAVTPTGVLRVDRQQWQSKTTIEAVAGDSLTLGNGLNSNAAWRIIIDSEGNTWVASNSGLDQLRRTLLKTLVLPPADEHQFSIAAGEANSVWIGNSSLPLTHVTLNSATTTYPAIRHITCIRRDRHGTIWVAGDSIFRRAESSTTFKQVHYPEENIARVVNLAVDLNDELWINLQPGQTYHLTSGGWKRENDALGKKPGIIGAMTSDEDRNIWFMFATYLIRWDGVSLKKYAFSPGPLDLSVVAMNVRGDHVWLAGQAGVIMFSDGHFYPMHFLNPAMPGRISGIVETNTGDLWMNGFSGITRVPAGALRRWVHDPRSPVSAESFGSEDGLPGLSSERFPVPSLIDSEDKRLWFATTRGVAWLDLESIGTSRNLIPPPIYIRSIFANGTNFVATNNTKLPKGTEALEINYTAPGLTLPRRVLFRYKLEGVDDDWQEPTSRRQAFYTNLAPGPYRFHVIACNNDGVWNETGATVAFTIAPRFFQTLWFKLLLGVIAVGLLVWSVQLRIHRITRNLNARLSERLTERERIARDLHDSFFQSIQGLLLRFNTGLRTLPLDNPARNIFEEALLQSDQVMAEGRELVLELRKNSVGTNDLPDSLAAFGEELKQVFSADFRVIVQGPQTELHPIVADELLRLGKEALNNSFSHAKAKAIEIELNFESHEVRLCIRDDGIGIDSEILHSGCLAGHWGLPGMKERANKIGAHFVLWSKSGVGTEIDVRVPARLAYPSSKRSIWKRYRQRITSRQKDQSL